MLVMLDKLGIAAWLTNTEGVVDECNTTACGLVDRTKEEVLGMQFVEGVVSEGSREVAGGVLGQAVEGTETSGTFMSAVTKDGANVEVMSDMGPRRKRGKINGAMVLAQRSKDGEALFKLDVDGKVQDCNKKALGLLGLEKAEDVIGKDFVGDVAAEEGKEAAAEAIGKALGGEAAYGVGTALAGKDEEVVKLDADVTQRLSPSGEVAGVMVSGGVGGDDDFITSEGEMLVMLDKLGIAAWLTNTEGVVDECNKTACGLVGRSREEQQGMGLVGELVSERDRGEARACLAALARPAGVCVQPSTHHTKSRHVRPTGQFSSSLFPPSNRSRVCSVQWPCCFARCFSSLHRKTASAPMMTAPPIIRS